MSGIDMDMGIHQLTDRYVAVWNEPDAERRRAAIRELWSADAVHMLQPPRSCCRPMYPSTSSARGTQVNP